MEIIVENEGCLDSAAAEFLAALGPRTHVAFRAPMGAGKTTFISAVCRVLGMEEEATSPTFSIVNEYRGGGRTVYHFDFYRIDDVREAIDLGLDEYFDSGALCLMEWPDVAEALLPDDTVTAEITVLPDESRKITLNLQDFDI